MDKRGDHLIDYVRYVTSPLKIKKETSYLKQFYKILKYKNIPKYYLVQDVKTPYALSKLSATLLVFRVSFSRTFSNHNV